MAQEFGFRPRLLWNSDVDQYFRNAYGGEKFSRICDSLTRPSTQCCIRVNLMQATVEEIIQELRKHTSSQGSDPICYQHPLLKNVVIFQGEGPCQVRYEDDAPRKIVMVSRRCAEAVLRGAEVFVPGVLACSEHVDQGDTVAIFARLEVQDASGSWSNGITRGTTLHQKDTLSYLGDRPNDLFIGKGRALMSRATMFRENQGLAVELIERVYRLPSLHGLLPGKIFLQNLPSIVTAVVLDPKPGENVLDMCAAPGGKSTAIASLMKNTGTVIALDRSHKKVADIVSLANELGLSNIQAYKLDALKCVRSDISPVDFMNELEKEVLGFITSLAESETPQAPKDSGRYTSKAQERKEAQRLKTGGGEKQTSRMETTTGFPPKFFDKVLLDAPCSALGLRPRLFAAQETLESLRKHATYQRRMFDKAVQLVRPGGFIVYSTCTINPGENESLVRYALDKYKFLSLAPQEPRIGGPGLVGGTDAFDAAYRNWLKDDEAHLVQRFDPSSSVDSIGFFIAKFEVAEH